MIHLALSIASFLFLLWFFAVCGVALLAFLALTWRWLLGALVVLSLVVAVNLDKSKQSTPPPIQAANQQSTVHPFQEPRPVPAGLTDAVVSSLGARPGDSPPSLGNIEGARGAKYREWLVAMQPRLLNRYPQLAQPAEFLQTLWYESARAGLDPALVLGLIEVESRFQKYAISEDGKRGYMQVASKWSGEIGDGDAAKLFVLQTNLRFGCVVLRHYLDQERGDVYAALVLYFGQTDEALKQGDADAIERFATAVLQARKRWGQ